MSVHTRGLSKNKIKYINALSLKKNRDEQACFIAEGSKLVYDLYQEIQPLILVATQAWVFENDPQLHKGELIIVEPAEMKQISSLKTAPAVLGVFPKEDNEFINNPAVYSKHSLLLLDGIQDPGNFGTILRTASWFGINYLVCSKDTVDLYNPKVVQASMGALIHVKVNYTSLPNFISQLKDADQPVFGTFMQGTNLYESRWKTPASFVLGNEGKGISSEVQHLLSERMTIPHALQSFVPESLNVSSAATVICSEIFRRS